MQSHPLCRTRFAFRPIPGLISCTGVTWEMGTAISCTECSHVNLRDHVINETVTHVRARLGQCWASSAVLGRQGDGDCYLLHRVLVRWLAHRCFFVFFENMYIPTSLDLCTLIGVRMSESHTTPSELNSGFSLCMLYIVRQLLKLLIERFLGSVDVYTYNLLF